uniref:Uncharacterized protein n=1 Tax=Arundo donax TaxID=35708 RepID=A0A0A9BT77_ARUDO
MICLNFSTSQCLVDNKNEYVRLYCATEPQYIIHCLNTVFFRVQRTKPSFRTEKTF